MLYLSIICQNLAEDLSDVLPLILHILICFHLLTSYALIHLSFFVFLICWTVRVPPTSSPQHTFLECIMFFHALDSRTERCRSVEIMPDRNTVLLYLCMCVFTVQYEQVQQRFDKLQCLRRKSPHAWDMHRHILQLKTCTVPFHCRSFKQSRHTDPDVTHMPVLHAACHAYHARHACHVFFLISTI